MMKAGDEVRVVAPCFVPFLAAQDQALMARRPWCLQTVDFRSKGWRKLRAVKIRGTRRLAAELFPRWQTDWLLLRACSMAAPELFNLAASEPADWFIAHTQAALPIAARAAECWNAKLGFDCEDLLAHAPGEPADLMRAIEARYIRRCDYISAASRSMAEQLAREYGIPVPVVFYNVFPLDLAGGEIPPKRRPKGPLFRLHWFGQTIGPGRGLEDAIEALAMLPRETELYLRGVPARGFSEWLYARAGRLGVEARIKLLPLVEHDELIRTVSEFDVGLALERNENENASVTVSNKLFGYLLGGLAIAATNTSGQREILDQVPACGFLYPSGDARALAEGLMTWVDDREKLYAAQQAAWDAARSQFCWDLEQRKFLAIFVPTHEPEPAAQQAGKSRK